MGRYRGDMDPLGGGRGRRDVVVIIGVLQTRSMGPTKRVDNSTKITSPLINKGFIFHTYDQNCCTIRNEGER